MTTSMPGMPNGDAGRIARPSKAVQRAWEKLQKQQSVEETAQNVERAVNFNQQRMQHNPSEKVTGEVHKSEEDPAVQKMREELANEMQRPEQDRITDLANERFKTD